MIVFKPITRACPIDRRQERSPVGGQEATAAVKRREQAKVISLREFAGKEVAALDAESARAFPEPARARITLPHQNVEPWRMSREELFSARDSLTEWQKTRERAILGDQTKRWRRASRRGGKIGQQGVVKNLKLGKRARARGRRETREPQHPQSKRYNERNIQK